MPGVCRDGDINQVNGKTTKGDKTVLTNGRPTASKGDTYVMPHPHGKKKHPLNPYMLNCSKNVLVGGRPMGHENSIDKCMHSMKTKSEDVLVEM